MNNKIYTIRDCEVMIDRDLADIFDIQVKRLNERVKRNIKLFEESDRFQLNNNEFEDWKSQFATLNKVSATLKTQGKHSKFAPFVFTKSGVEILVKILEKDIDIDSVFSLNNQMTILPVNEDLRSKIFDIRGFQVMLDFDLALLFQVETKRLNEQVKRNLNRFPTRFRFQLNETEMNELVANCDRFKTLKHSTNLPFVFSEQGIAMLATVLHSEIAVDISIQIMDAFVEMRKLIANNATIFQRLGNIEQKLVANDIKFQKSDENFNKLFDALNANELKPKQGIFYDGQVFDAYALINKIIRNAKKSIVLIDNYIDDSILTLFSKRNNNVAVTIYTQYITPKMKLDLQKYNEQYPKIKMKIHLKSHDRFMIIDDNELYHIGASLKDLGKKWFGITKFESGALDMLHKLKGKK